MGQLNEAPLRLQFGLNDPDTRMWIERAKGTPHDNPNAAFTVEIACSLLKKGAVCWLALAADDAGLQTFEHGLVTLDSEAPIALVPADAFAKKPS